MKNIPKYIYLQVDPDRESPEDFNNLKGITWCEERENPNDIQYIRVETKHKDNEKAKN